MNHEEIIAGFRGFTVTFQSEDGLILWNKKECHRFVDFGEAPADSLFRIDHDPSGVAKLCSAGSYRKACAKKLGDDVAGCLTGFFFTTAERFEAIPWGNQPPAGCKSRGQLLFYSLVCKKEEAARMEKALRVLCSKAGLLRGDEFRTIPLANHTVFSMGAWIFAHIAQPAMFATRCGFESELEFKKGKKEDVIGQFNADTWVDPARNRFHPDWMTKE
jgi:hypothetical protein